MNKFQILDLQHVRHIFTVGDIHGYFTLMEEKLDALGFDPELDHVISLGDLTDRGPDSLRAVEFCEKPWFHWVRGNHEQMVFENAYGGTSEAGHHRKVGGLWTMGMSNSELRKFSDTINAAPNILEVIAPSGKRYGFVHAAMPVSDWNEAEMAANDLAHFCMWDRTVAKHPWTMGIKNIDHVYHGHTPFDDNQMKTVANVSWIDTGVIYKDGDLTVLKIE